MKHTMAVRPVFHWTRRRLKRIWPYVSLQSPHQGLRILCAPDAVELAEPHIAVMASGMSLRVFLP